MEKKQDFMQTLFILITISDGENEIEKHGVEKTSEHSSEEDARNSMITEKLGYYIVIRVKSDGADTTSNQRPAYKTPSDGSAEGKIIHFDEGLEGIARNILTNTIEVFSSKLKDAANKERRKANLASGKKTYA